MYGVARQPLIEFEDTEEFLSLNLAEQLLLFAYIGLVKEEPKGEVRAPTTYTDRHSQGDPNASNANPTARHWQPTTSGRPLRTKIPRHEAPDNTFEAGAHARENSGSATQGGSPHQGK